MFNIPKTVCGLDITDEKVTVVAKISTSNGQKFTVTNLVSDNATNENSGTLLGNQPDSIAVALGESDSKTSVVENVNASTLEVEKRKRGITENQNFNYVTIERASSGLLSALNKEIAAETLTSTLQKFPKVTSIVINHIVVVLLYLYYRCLQKITTQTDRIAMLHCTGQYLSLLVIEKGLPVWSGVADIRPKEVESRESGENGVATTQGEIPLVVVNGYSLDQLPNRGKRATQTVEVNTYQEIYLLMQNANEKTKGSHYDHLFLSGACDLQDVKSLHHCAAKVSLLPLFQEGAFEPGNTPGVIREELEMNGHRFAIAIGTAAMALEEIGVNLATENGLTVELSAERSRPESMKTLSPSLAAMASAGANAIPGLIGMAQKRLLIVSIFITICLIGYKFWSAESLLNQLAHAKQVEEQRADSLRDVREKYDSYQARVNAVTAQRSAIEALRREQLLVRTVIDEIDRRVPAGLVFSDLTIQGNSIDIRGYAPAKPAVSEYALNLGREITMFSNVVPTYDDNTNKGNYQIKATFIGAVPVNSIPLPVARSGVNQVAAQKGNGYGN